MGSGSSNANTVTPEPIPTTVTWYTTVYTSAADLKSSEVKCWIDNHEILYVSLAFISGIVLTFLFFAITHIFRKRCKRCHQSSQEQVPSQTVTEECARNVQPQNEVAYATLVFQQSGMPMAV
ncbi:transmembrane protein C1orf162 homolog isoform X2 [Falco biarmicus]|uniref:transmembrane protein C1orf162 homolog isoform X2 n=1 Tax=Falco cherrug TaxID=345164 RepID=UPI0006B7FBB1|nr:transmembrane protein C1orf162 homolog isoform X2 [Falco cherrug]XP_056217282.1 transmembrane protein C1orf162 homolog isoform X2 [Falco biarmicus]